MSSVPYRGRRGPRAGSQSRDDVIAVLRDFRENGEAIQDEDGLLAARRRVGNATFWVKFSRTDGGFLVHRAWSHRMNVVKREG